MNLLQLFLFATLATGCTQEKTSDALTKTAQSRPVKDNYVNETYSTTAADGIVIRLSQNKNQDASTFEPEFKDLTITVGEASLVLDGKLTESELYSPAFAFHSSSVRILSSDAKHLRFDVRLGQSGCSGDFCRDFVVIELDYQKADKQLTWSYHDESN